MKKIAIFTILLIIILGCSKNEEEILTVSSYSYINETSPYDTSIRVSVEEINGILKIRITKIRKSPMNGIYMHLNQKILT